MRVVLSDAAKASLREIGLFIGRHDKVRARSFVRELQAKARAVADAPEAFPLVPSHESSGIRRRIHGAYLIFYRIEPYRITIVNILHGAQDYQVILFPE